MTTAQDTERAGVRPASGIVIVPEQLTRMRDRKALSREDLAEKTGELLFDREAFARVMSGEMPADARLARALWVTLGCRPEDIIRGLPPDLGLAAVPRWLRAHPDDWALDLDAVTQLAAVRGWTRDALAGAMARHWFSRDSVNKIERGERRPKARTLRAFCEVLRCRPEQLMPGGKELPDGKTRMHRELLDYNEGMRAFADAQDPPISYRNPDNNRIRYTAELREAYEDWLAGLDEDAGKAAREERRRRLGLDADSALAS
jgi:transcriptional regulator with XRE-family HTH domain